MRLQPILYTTEMSAATRWYGTVLGNRPTYASDVWTSFDVGDGHLALHRTDSLPTDSRVALSLVATESLEEIVARLAVAGITPERGIQDEAFGRSILLRDPDGSPVQVNEH